MTREDAAKLSPADLRKAMADGLWLDTTVGLGLGYLHTNVAILPEKYAFDFLLYCVRNPKPCPVIHVSEPGDPIINTVSAGSDIRDDISRYCVFEKGELVATPTSLRDYWRPDAVTFLLGCSVTFEQALINNGVPMRHHAQGSTPGVYITDIPCAPAGQFAGPVVASVRAIPGHLVSRAVEVTSRYPWGHGSPLHIGDPSLIGVDLSKPDYGDVPVFEEGDVPVFWGCGVTPQLALSEAKPEYMFSHYPAHMYVADVTSDNVPR